jgi:hypothetical protein
VLAQPLSRQMYRVLRLDKLLRPSLRMPGLLLTGAIPLRVLLPAAGLVALAGAFSLRFEGMGWIFALLVLTAVVTALAQQTLP